MKRYRTIARELWARFLPRLGQEAQEEIDELTDRLAGDDPQGEDYGKIGRLNTACQHAREKVLAEQVLLPAEPGSPTDEELDEQTEPETLDTKRTTAWIHTPHSGV
jgi:hypothetical protein